MAVRFARRTDWPRRENALAAARRRAAARADFVDLSISNPTRLDLVHPPERLAPLAFPAGLVYRAEPLGLLSARAAVAAWHRRRGLDVRPERVVLTASTSEAYAWLFRLLAEPDEAVLVPTPSYPLFDYLLALADLRSLPYRWAWDGSWHLDRDSVDAALAAGDARVLLDVAPNNPTGHVPSPEERRFLAERAAAAGLAVISDEVFADASPDPRAASWIGSGGPLSFSLHGLSKAAGLPQLKLAWIVVDGPEAEAEEAIARLELIADTYLSVATPVQLALPALLEAAEPWQASLRDRLDTNRARLAAACAGRPLSPRAAFGGWSAIVELPRTESDEDWALHLLEAGLAVQPGYLFELETEATIVISLLLEPRDFAVAVDRLIAAVEARLGDLVHGGEDEGGGLIGGLPAGE
jgi:alanine-synthesizing transaminase